MNKLPGYLLDFFAVKKLIIATQFNLILGRKEKMQISNQLFFICLSRNKILEFLNINIFKMHFILRIYCVQLLAKFK